MKEIIMLCLTNRRFDPLRGGAMIIMVVLSISCNGIAFAQSDAKKVRRWFIILNDFSGPFYRQKDINHQLYQLLHKLFDNEAPDNSDDDNTILLKSEKATGIPFFLKDDDEISLFYFGIRKQDLHQINTNPANSTYEQYNEFIKRLLHQTIADWSVFYQKDTSFTVASYLRAFKAGRKKWNDGYTFSAYAYPAVLTTVKDRFFQELIVIIISDFRSGSTFGNKHDNEIVRQSIFPFYPQAAKKVFETNNWLNGQFYKIDYFDYAIPTGKRDSAGNKIIHGIKAYKIKPHSSASFSENATIKIDSEVELTQRKFGIGDYNLSPITVNFAHSENLQVERIGLTISDANGQVLAKKDVAFLDKATGELLTRESKVLLYDLVTNNYIIPSQFLQLPGINDLKSLHSYSPSLELNFYTQFQAGISKVPFLYKASRTLSNDTVNFVSELDRQLILYGLSGIVFLLALIVWLRSGRPKKIYYEMQGFTDSYERINYRSKESGKIKAPYRAFDVQEQSARVTFKFWMHYRRHINAWRLPVYIKLDYANAEQDDLVDIHLRLKHEDQYVAVGDTFLTHALKKNEFPFEMYLVIKKNDYRKDFTEPVRCLFKLRLWVEYKNLWKVRHSCTIEESFYIGSDLGEVWHGLDPGTTGTCIAAGSHYSNLTIEKNANGEDLISPSLIGFDTEEEVILGSDRMLADKVYQVGDSALSLINLTERFTFFRSIKKLLGYVDSQAIDFHNGNALHMNGVEITTLLIKQLLKNLKAYIERNPSEHHDLLTEGYLQSAKAVVAVPNNFTATKTQAMLDSVHGLCQFKELRVITEAEAIMIYYMFNRAAIMANETLFQSERALIFDMGGATINTTVVKAYEVKKKSGTTYRIEIKAKLGYGIGGDTIDYCLINYLYQHLKAKVKLPANSLNYQAMNKIQKNELSELAQKLKMLLVQNFGKKTRPDTLIGPGPLINALERLYFILTGNQVKIRITEEDKLLQELTKNNDQYDIFSSPHFHLIYQNVKTATEDTLNQLGDKGIDTLIFSGRSTLFPLIKGVVKQSLKNRGIEVKEATLKNDELKSAVAKGACLYGINNNAIKIDNYQANSHFGFIHTQKMGESGFEKLIGLGDPFNGKKAITGNSQPRSEFNLDGKHVRFIQVMGQDAKAIVHRNEKHKYATLAKVKVHSIAETVGLTVSENDEIRCMVKEPGNQVFDRPAMVRDEEIQNANDEHYTWLL